ncbi:hypothetical protein JJB98_18060 [Bradyrhizobium diazoefficiens]|nr:hypothetical protein [Bradyrhizobium diazoefficiens]QQO21706.1 hypothetical protein JJB98_18060 [Bradyrhizobium diazoefficiens]
MRNFIDRSLYDAPDQPGGKSLPNRFWIVPAQAESAWLDGAILAATEPASDLDHPNGGWRVKHSFDVRSGQPA